MLWLIVLQNALRLKAPTFSFVYGTETMVPIVIIVPSARLALASKILDSYDLVEKRRDVDLPEKNQ